MLEKPLVDGFVYSASLLYLPTTFRSSALSQMELLRRATGYRNRQWCVPETLEEPIGAYSQVEYQVRTQPGAYVWGLMFSAPTSLNGDVDYASSIHIQITDACTETPLLSDYSLGSLFTPQTGPGKRNPFIFPQPCLVGEPALLDVEVYNSAAVDVFGQLVLFLAEPSTPPQDIQDELKRLGYGSELTYA